jgi:hypothetical protein
VEPWVFDAEKAGRGIHPIVIFRKAATEYDRKPGAKWLSYAAKLTIG